MLKAISGSRTLIMVVYLGGLSVVMLRTNDILLNGYIEVQIIPYISLHSGFGVSWVVAGKFSGLVVSAEGVLKMFGRYVPPRFSKVGSLELSFGFETGISVTNFC